ncbi:hypothetical protein [Streptomyces achromogenes]|uniref:hypothetical protein n=1 Tax=Streptomyces achromogenes TaxID=67255 RepID=UPI003A7F982B
MRGNVDVYPDCHASDGTAERKVSEWGAFGGEVAATRYIEPLRSGGSVPGVVEADDLGTKSSS